MRITVNSEPREVPDGATVAELIESLGLDKAVCAAEVNRRLVPARERAGAPLHDGDIVEVVTLVGGG